MKKSKAQTARSIAMTAVTLSAALLLGVIENLLPPIFPALPFFRLGLSNVAVLFAVVTLGCFRTAVVVAVKSFLVPIFASNPVMFLYSLPAGLLSFSLSFLLAKTKKPSLVTIGFLSAVLNNLVQLCVAAAMTGSAAVFFYFPYLALLGGLSGILTGALAALLVRALPERFALDGTVRERRRKVAPERRAESDEITNSGTDDRSDEQKETPKIDDSNGNRDPKRKTPSRRADTKIETAIKPSDPVGSNHSSDSNRIPGH